MATEKETIIYDFQIEQGDAINDLERFKRGIIQTREEQKQLNDAYKKGSVTLEEYASESVRMEQVLKKETTAYNELTKKVQGHESQTDKLIKSNKALVASNEKIAGGFQQMAGNINIAGTNLGSLTSGMTAFLNPVTAAGAAVGALATAYFNTGRGAQDLERIQFTLQATTEVLSNKVADLVDKFKDPESTIGKFGRALIDTNPIIQGLKFQMNLLFGDTKEEINALADIKDKLDDLNQSRAVAQAEFNNLLDDNSTLSAEIAEASTTYLDKLDKTALMQDNITNAYDKTLKIKYEEVRLLDEVLKVNENDEATQRRKNAILLEIAQEERKREKMLSAVKKTTDNIVEAEQKKLGIISEQNTQLEIGLRLQKEAEELQAKKENEENTQELLDSLNKEKEVITENIVVEQEATEEIVTQFDARTVAAMAYYRQVNRAAQETNDLLNLYVQDGWTRAQAEKLMQQQKTMSIASGARMIGDSLTQLAGKNKAAAISGVVISKAGAIGEIFSNLGIANLKATAASPLTAGQPWVAINSIFAGLQAANAVKTAAESIGQINSVAMAGGGHFTTKGPTWLLVGDNPGGRERVSVTPESGKGQTRVLSGSVPGIAMAGGGSINGSILAASQTNPIDAQFSLNDAIRSMPAPVLEYTEFTRFVDKVTYKESVTTA